MNQSSSPSTAPAVAPARDASHSTIFYQKLTTIDGVRELLASVKSLQNLVEGMCPHLRNHETILAQQHQAERETLERRLREADIIPPPKRLRMRLHEEGGRRHEQQLERGVG